MLLRLEFVLVLELLLLVALLLMVPLVVRKEAAAHRRHLQGGARQPS
jgi:hypothetical protein